ncbi:MAG: response regulator [Patescibacteria group bacterium]
MTKKKILLVEDEPLLIGLYKEAFSEEPYSMSVAESGTDALVQVNNNKPDLILLDILLPGMNGFEVLRKIKASSKSRDIPVIVLTNLGSEETDKDRQLALSLGAIDYLVKSYHTPEEMIKIVRSRLSSK